MKGKLIIALLPVAGIIFLVLIIMAIIAAFFGSEDTIIRNSFTLPFDTQNYTITSKYGVREDPISGETKKHNGIDVVPSGTTDIFAVADGIVVSSDIDSAGAEYVIIEHTIEKVKYRTGYWHLKEDSRVVKAGDQVKQGQQIGIMGSTGYSTGPHLHLFLQEYNSSKNSFEYTDPSNIITNKVLAKSYNRYDYDTNKYSNSSILDDRFDYPDLDNRFGLPTFP